MDGCSVFGVPRVAGGFSVDRLEAKRILWCAAVLCVSGLAGCGSGGGTAAVDGDGAVIGQPAAVSTTNGAGATPTVLPITLPNRSVVIRRT